MRSSRHNFAASNIFRARSVEEAINKTEGKHKNMKKVIIGLACAAVAPFAFAQTTTTEQTTTAPATTTTTSTTYTDGTVSTYEPGKTIVVKDEREGPVSFALHAPVRVIDRAGHVVSRALTPKDRVRVYYTGTGETRVVDHVQVED
jgi:hypothetical protein